MHRETIRQDSKKLSIAISFLQVQGFQTLVSPNMIKAFPLSGMGFMIFFSIPPHFREVAFYNTSFLTIWHESVFRQPILFVCFQLIKTATFQRKRKQLWKTLRRSLPLLYQVAC